ncbi:TA system antitoxin ParD family protein [Porticoccus sp.]
MAKAKSPVRLDERLMSQATVAGAAFHRSAAEQVEYWASIGRAVAEVVDENSLISVLSGTARIKAEKIRAPRVDPDRVFDTLERMRDSGELSRQVSGAKLRYQASQQHPGFLEQIDPAGRVTVGKYQDGQFIAALPGERP